MELDAVYIELTMAQGHDLSLIADGRYIQTLREVLFRDNPRVVASYGKVGVDAAEELILSDEMAGSSHPMEHIGQVLQLGTEGLADGLMAEADPEHRFTSSVGLDDIQQQPRLRRDARTRGQNYLAIRLQVWQLELVVAQNADLRAQFLDQMTQIISERVIIINNNNFHS